MTLISDTYNFKQKNISSDLYIFLLEMFLFPEDANPHTTLAIRQKGKSPNSSYKKTKDAKFSKKLIFLTECIKG